MTLEYFHLQEDLNNVLYAALRPLFPLEGMNHLASDGR